MNPRHIIVSAAVTLALFAGLRIILSPELDAGSEHPPRSRDASPDLSPSSSDMTPTHVVEAPEAVGVQPPHEVPAVGSDLDVPRREFLSAAGLFRGLPADWMPTPDGLMAATSELWAQPEFLDMTQAEAEAIFPLDEGLMAPADVREVLGDLPTREDAEAALRCPEAQRALEAFGTSSWIYATLLELPRHERGRGYTQTLEVMRVQRSEDEERLMQALDACGPFRRWKTFAGLYRRWAR